MITDYPAPRRPTCQVCKKTIYLHGRTTQTCYECRDKVPQLPPRIPGALSLVDTPEKEGRLSVVEVIT